MAYCRFGPSSSVYVFEHVGGFLTCCGCRLGDFFDTTSRSEMIEHLNQHRSAGHTVPQFVLDMLAEDVDLFGDEYVAD